MIKNALNSTAKFIAIIIALIVLVLLNFHLWKKDQVQEREIIALQQELALQQQENAKISLVNSDLKQKIHSLKQGSLEMIEEEARNGFGMVGEGETFYHFDDKNSKIKP